MAGDPAAPLMILMTASLPVIRTVRADGYYLRHLSYFGHVLGTAACDCAWTLYFYLGRVVPVSARVGTSERAEPGGRRGAARRDAAGAGRAADWVEAVWAEAPEVSPGLRRLAWRAGGVRLIAREALMRRRIGTRCCSRWRPVAAWAAWPGSPASVATPVDRVDVITMVLMLAGLPLLARWFFGRRTTGWPAGSGSAATPGSWP